MEITKQNHTITKQNKHQLLSLKAKIKGLACEGRSCHKFITNTIGISRARHWTEKRTIGLEARYHLIAYGLLQGIDYNIIESNSNKDILFATVNLHYLATIIQHHCYILDRPKWNVSYLKSLLKYESDI